LSDSCVNTVNHSYEICGYIQKFVTFNLCNFHGVMISSYLHQTGYSIYHIVTILLVDI